MGRQTRALGRVLSWGKSGVATGLGSEETCGPQSLRDLGVKVKPLFCISHAYKATEPEKDSAIVL